MGIFGPLFFDALDDVEQGKYALLHPPKSAKQQPPLKHWRKASPEAVERHWKEYRDKVL